MSEHRKLSNDGFYHDTTDDRLIQGTILRCVDGHWSDRDGVPFPIGIQMIALGVNEAVQCWRDRRPVDTIIRSENEKLPDVDDLNAKIPTNDWEAGLDGEPRPPWVHSFCVYLLSLDDASVYTYINSTAGAAIAVRRLRECVVHMRALRGERVVPIVALEARPMQTRFGVKQRPEFGIIEWRERNDHDPALARRAPTQIEQQSEETSPNKANKRTQNLKRDKPVNTGEDLEDDTPS